MQKIAVVHDWFAGYGGSERAVEQMLACYPHSQLYALVDFMSAEQREFLKGRPVQTSFLQRLPFAERHFRQYLPLMPLAIEQFDMRGYDIVISSSHAVAKGVITSPDQLHVSYVHTPIRYAWDMHHQYLDETGLNRGLKGWLVRAVLHYLRMWDRAAASRVDLMLTNSHYIARRIWKCYRRKARVIYGPADVDAFPLHEQKEDFYLTASRLVPYKRVELIARAFSRLPDRQLVIIGDGPDYSKVAAAAAPNVKLLGHQPHHVLRDHMQRARAFVFAAEEDLGLSPIEAQACGTPVIAFGRGGVTDTVVTDETGIFFEEQSPESLTEAIERFETISGRFDPAAIRAHAEKFSAARFRERLTGHIDAAWDRFQIRCKRHGPVPRRQRGFKALL
jgi:glycosyltransferase involved in cell wall biosynthesis